MGKKKGKGGKEPRSADVLKEGQASSVGAGDGKKSRRKKRDLDEDFDDDLASLANELGLDDAKASPNATTSVSSVAATTTTTAAAATTTTTATTTSTTSAAIDGISTASPRANTATATPATTAAALPVASSHSEAQLQDTSVEQTVSNTKAAKRKKAKVRGGEGATVADSTGHGERLGSQSSILLPTPPDGGVCPGSEAVASTGTASDGSKASVTDAAGDTKKVNAAEEDDGEDGGEADDEKKKKKKKKKKKTVEEEKKPKGPGKAALSKIKKIQAALEEEKLRREQEALAAQRAEEEREQLRLENLRLEKERKEKLRQKEKDRKLRRKLEGKPVTRKEKEAESRRQAQLAALEEQGMFVPGKGVGAAQTKKVVYGSRTRTKKADLVGDTPEQDVKASVHEIERIWKEEEEEEGEKGSVTFKQSVDSWEDLGSDQEQQEEEVSVGVVSTAVDKKPKQEKREMLEEGGGEEEEEEEGEGESSCHGSSSEEDNDLSPLESARLRIQKRRMRHEAECSADTLRSPVVCVLGHVDTGKTKILDKIRSTSVQEGEAGGITQQIGATFIPVEVVREQTKMLKEFSREGIRLPGLLIIDTPGHESFSNLRTRGSSMCDVAILVVDIMHGLEAQTRESLKLLKKGCVSFIIALNKVDSLYEWFRNPNASVRDTLKKQKTNTREQFEERVKDVTAEFAVEGMNVAMFWEKVDFNDYLPMVPTSAITGDGMGDLIALLVQHSTNKLHRRLMLSMEVEALVMEVKVIAGLGTTIDIILRNGVLREGDSLVLCGNEGPFVATVRALLMPQPLRELRVKNSYVSHTAVMAAQGVKVIAKGELEKTLPGTRVLVAKRSDEIDVLKEEASAAMENVLNAIKLQDRGVYVQASTLGSLEALLEFLKQSQIPYSGINIGPVHKRDVMRASVMLEHDNQWAVILAFDVRVERDAQEMADSVGVKVFSADIIYHLFDAFLKHREELREKNRLQYQSIAVFPCKVRVLPNCVFNSRDPIVVGVVVEAGIVKAGTTLTVPSKNFIDIGVVTSLEVNHKQVESVKKGVEVCLKIEPVGGDAPRLYGRHFDHTDMLVSKVSRESIDAVKNYFRDDLNKSDWQLMIELKKIFQIM